ncbi:hypothetical protein C0Z17_02025 [Trinickia caryophylli]|nr:hypothetical protein C0Z17_02025 [Trinickia caryophylli]
MRRRAIEYSGRTRDRNRHRQPNASGYTRRTQPSQAAQYSVKSSLRSGMAARNGNNRSIT